MGDFLFDPETRDLVIQNGDFVIQSDPSVQNGAIIRDAHCFSLRFPIYGIGMQTVINAPLSIVNFEMNRWVSQVKSDGVTKANFTAELVNGLAKVNNTVSYD
jgi:hypothetical protein